MSAPDLRYIFEHISPQEGAGVRQRRGGLPRDGEGGEEHPGGGGDRQAGH